MAMKTKKQRKLPIYVRNCKADIRRAMGMMTNPSAITAKSIVDSYGVSLRTAQRVLQQLRAEPPIDWKKIRRSGYIQLPQ